jgi:hypothetical protein
VPALRRLRAALLALGLCCTLAACSDFTLVAVTATPNLAALPSLPPIGFNHRYGNTPVGSADAFKLERALYAEHVYWEVAIRTDPVLAGYVPLNDKKKVQAARHRATDLYIVIATEDAHTIEGMLAFPSHAGQQGYCTALLDAIRADGYDAITKAYVLVFFTESDQHAKLTWTSKSGYSFAVFDKDLVGTALAPKPAMTPLPSPPA